MSVLDHYLRKFDQLIDPERETRIANRYQEVYQFKDMEQLPFCWSDLPPIADSDWPDYAYNDTFTNREKMLLSQLRAPFLHYTSGDDYPLAIRANYGTVILPSILGASWQLTEDSMPWAFHLPDRDAIRRLVDSGVPGPRSGLGAACLDTAEYFYETLSKYPALSQAVYIYHPDLQGPFDVAHLLWGPDIFLGFYDCPDLVHALLRLVTETYITWLTHWKAAVGEGNAWTVHWNNWQRGGAMLRDDSAVMLSTAQYREFVQPYDQQVLDVFGGCTHFCGRGDQFVESMTSMRNLFGLNMSQPELNNMQQVRDLCLQRRIVLINIQEAYIPPETKTGVTLARSWLASQKAA